jgi:NAD(P)H-nitrite reductase large subunit
MLKLGLLASIATIIGTLSFATFSAPAVAAPEEGACVHTELKTETVKAACAKGGQKEAKEVMKAFMKSKKLKSCNECHKNLAPKYDLKPDGHEKFLKLGGK